MRLIIAQSEHQEKSEFHDVYLPITGGVLEKGLRSMEGSQTEALLRPVRALNLLAGVESVDMDRRWTVPDAATSCTMRSNVKHVTQTAVAADHSKLSRNTLSTIASLAETVPLTIDVGASEEITERLMQHIEIVQA